MLSLTSAVKGGVNMINFVIYEDNKEWQRYYKEIILNIIGCTNHKYTIHAIDKYDSSTKKQINSLTGKNIYLLDLEVPGKSGLDFANEIRKSGDWHSQIIIITSHEQFKNEGFTNKTLMLDFIIKKANIAKDIKEAIETALEIHNYNTSFNFSYNNEFYQIPTKDILYFEKDLNNNYTNIVTKKESFKTKQSLTNIEEMLETDYHFFKTHRSCIVNIKNIFKADLTNNIIYFRNHEINLISRDRKKLFKEKLLGGDCNDDL